jgi:hypothetical protein
MTNECSDIEYIAIHWQRAWGKLVAFLISYRFGEVGGWVINMK